MSNDNIYKIPKRINDPIMFAYFQWNSVVLVSLALMVGMWAGLTLELLVASIAYLYSIKYLGEKWPAGRLKHYLWYIGLLPAVSPKLIENPEKRLAKLKVMYDPLKREWFR